MRRTGKIILEDAWKHQFVVVLTNCKDLSSVQQLAERLQTYSAAAVIGYSLTDEIFLSGTTISGAYERVEQQLKLVFRSDADTIYFYIPAPKDSTVDAHQEASATLAGDIKQLIESTTTYTSLIYKGGGLVSQFPYEIGGV